MMLRSPCLAQIEKWEHQMYFDQRSVALCDDPSAAPSRVGASFAADRAGDEIVQLSACVLSDLIASFLAKPGQDWAAFSLPTPTSRRALDLRWKLFLRQEERSMGALALSQTAWL